ncbi:hypothetical protein HHK36_024923 [Tetracentron sinense]|uniref:Uncharacterized protein n=1 Tax=Tetracentron sinense TaxID=13715 RepID=A0A834YQW9_TETSI|nr:hypothetical protein HHK36_024923 [Tetracentron sinense]
MRRSTSTSSSQLDRKTDKLPIEDRIDQAAIYIKQLKERIEELKARKEVAMSINNNSSDTMTMDSRVLTPVLELRDLDSTIELILITGKNNNFMFSEVINVLEEEGASVVSASFDNIGDRVLHTIHSQVTSSRVGVEISRLSERLKKLVYSEFQEPSISRP